MTELDALLAGIVSDPLEETRWLVLADWLEENDDVRRGELLRLHRKLLATCCEPDAQLERKSWLNRVVNVFRDASATRRLYSERGTWQARVVELLGAGVRPCVPQETLQLPGGVPLTFAFVPPGSFLMGGTVNDWEKPIHKVTVTKGFFLGVYPVTQEQWKAVLGSAPSHFKGAKRPVEQVSWDDCQEFCTKLTADLKGRGRVELPTDAEWEYACRAGTTTEYHFGNVLNTDLANYSGDYTWNDSPKGKYRKETTDVGFFPANPWGLYDVHGNVWELCSDWYGDYSANGQCRLRGGSWSSDPGLCRAAYLGWEEPAIRYSHLGFRVCFRLD